MSNAYYTPTGKPVVLDDLSSSDLREEFVKIEEGFDRMPNATGNPNALVVINSSGNGIIALPGSDGLKLTGGSNADSQHTHSVENLDNTTATGANLNALTDGSDASALHNHTTDNLNDTTVTGAQLNTLSDGSDASALHNHTTANLNDTAATGPQLNNLVDGSDASALHNHSTDNLNDTTVTGTQLNNLVDGSNADALHIHAFSAIDIINSSTTLYLSPSGNDTTGDGSSGNPWFSINRAMEYLKYKIITADVTINIAVGNYNLSETQFITHPNSNRITFRGMGINDTLLNFSGINGVEIHDCVGLSFGGLISADGIRIISDNFNGKGLSLVNSSVNFSAEIKIIKFSTGLYTNRSNIEDPFDFYGEKSGIGIDSYQSNIYINNYSFSDSDHNGVDSIRSNRNSSILFGYHATISDCSTVFFANYNSSIVCRAATLSNNTTEAVPAAAHGSNSDVVFGNYGSFVLIG